MGPISQPVFFGELTIVAMSVIPGTPQSFENSTRVRDAQGLEYLEACLAEGLFESRLRPSDVENWEVTVKKPLGFFMVTLW